MKFDVEVLDETVVCSELTVGDYKALLKCSYGDQPDHKTFVYTIVDVLSNITNKPSDYFLHSSIIDVFLLLLKLKINSQSETCKVIVTKDNKQMNLELSFEGIYEDVKKWFSPYLNKTFSWGSVEVVFGSPTLSMLIEETIQDEIVYFLKGCKITNKHKKILTPTNTKEATLLLDNLPPKLVADLYAHFRLFAKTILTKNLLSRYNIEGTEQKLMFSPSLDSLIWFTKLMFNEPLDVFYDNLFYLTNLGRFSTSYIEECTPGEYTYFIKKLEQTLAKQQTSEEDHSQQYSNSEEELLVE